MTFSLLSRKMTFFVKMLTGGERRTRKVSRMKMGKLGEEMVEMVGNYSEFLGYSLDRMTFGFELRRVGPRTASRFEYNRVTRRSWAWAGRVRV